MINGKEFLDAKEKASKSLEKACETDKVDNEIRPILDLINQVEQYPLYLSQLNL